MIFELDIRQKKQSIFLEIRVEKNGMDNFALDLLILNDMILLFNNHNIIL
jgi:hypothetical protein